jgi:hypothetical protein
MNCVTLPYKYILCRLLDFWQRAFFEGNESASSKRSSAEN